MILSELKAKGWMLAAVAAGTLLAIQTWRLHSEQAAHAQLIASTATAKAGRAEAYAKDSDATAGKEQVNAATIQGASDAFTKTQPARDDSLRTDLSRVDGLRRDAERRAASYRAQAEAGAAACSRLADRSAALDRQLTEGLGVVAELRGLVEKRDAEVVLLRSVIDADRALMAQ